MDKGSPYRLKYVPPESEFDSFIFESQLLNLNCIKKTESESHNSMIFNSHSCMVKWLYYAPYMFSMGGQKIFRQ